MKITSLSYSTMLHILSFNSKISDKGEYIVIKTPSNPHHHWGNFLMFHSSPKDGDFESWRKFFIKEFKHNASIRHMAFAWDSTKGEAGAIEPFVEAGFIFELDDVLTARQLHPPANYNSEIAVREIVNDEDWKKACKLQISCDGKEGDKDYVTFVHKRMQAFRKISEMGLGAWFGAFFKEQLVADAGLYQGPFPSKYPEREKRDSARAFLFDNEGFLSIGSPSPLPAGRQGSGRAGPSPAKAASSRGSGMGSFGCFQLVKTHPDHRKKGICSTLLFHASEYGFNEMGFEKLVIVADRAYHAGKVYRSLGFEVTEYGASLILKNTFQ